MPRGTGTAIVEIEMPLELANEFVRICGLPQKGQEQWIAFALLAAKPEYQSPVDKLSKREKVQDDGGRDPSVSRACAIMCRDLQFIRWIHVQNNVRTPHDENEQRESAASLVRRACGVESRAELATNKEALGKWQKLLSEFQEATSAFSVRRK